MALPSFAYGSDNLTISLATALARGEQQGKFSIPTQIRIDASSSAVKRIVESVDPCMVSIRGSAS